MSLMVEVVRKGWDQQKRDSMLKMTRQISSQEGTLITPGNKQGDQLTGATKGSKSLEVIAAVFVDRTTEGALFKNMRAQEAKLSQ